MFNETVKAVIGPLLAEHGFDLVEEFKGSVHFESPAVALRFVQEQHSHSANLLIRRKVGGLSEELVDFSYVAKVILELGRRPRPPRSDGTSDVIAYYRDILQSNEEILTGDAEFFGKVKVIYEKDVDDYNRRLGTKS